MSSLKKVLSTLPKTLDETYDRILQGIKAEYRQDAITALRWLCFSHAPLTLSEIIEVLAIEVGDRGGFCPDERLPDAADIMIICSSLISCSDIDIEDHKAQIRLAHFSVKEYLLSDRCLLAEDFQASACHMVMAEGCLHYLLYLYQNLPITKSLVDEHPLSLYAAEYWWQHAQAISHIPGLPVIKLATNLLMNRDVGVLPWVQLYNIDDSKYSPDVKILNLSLRKEDIAQPLYYAALIGLAQIVENILHQNVDVNDVGGHQGTALEAACVNGHWKVVQILIDAGAGSRDNALHIGCSKGDEEVVQILMDAGTDINDTAGYRGTPLEVACSNGHERVVEMLLDARADVNAEIGGFYGSALLAASERGQKEVVLILLNAGADVNAKNEGSYGSAVQAAIHFGHDEVVQILLDAGADLDVEEDYRGHILQIASQGGHREWVQLPFENGMDEANPSIVTMRERRNKRKRE